LQGLQGFDPSKHEWIQAWLARLTAESQLLPFFEPSGAHDFGRLLTALSVEDPDRFRAFSSQLFPKLLSALLDAETDDSAWSRLFDEVSSSFPEVGSFDRSQILWFIRQVQATDDLLVKLRSTFEAGEIKLNKVSRIGAKIFLQEPSCLIR
jgi:hypothetical protein